MNWQYNPRWRLIWSGATGTVALAFVGLDAALRSANGGSPLAPRAANLWIAVAAGVALGVLASLWERHLLQNRKGPLVAFHSASLRDAFRWRHVKESLRMGGWLGLALVALVIGSNIAGVFVLPPVFATNAVLFATNNRLAGEVHEELQRQAVA